MVWGPHRPVARIFHGGGGGGGGGAGAHLKNRDQIINVGMAGRASAEDTKVSTGLGGIAPPEKL